MLLRIFEVGDDSYGLKHNTADDSRAVVDDANRPLLRFSSSLNITGPQGQCLGSIRTKGDHWTLMNGNTEHLLGPHNKFHWRALETAEIEAAKILIPQLTEKV